MAEHKVNIRPVKEIGLIRWLGSRWEWVCSCGMRRWYKSKAECLSAAEQHEINGDEVIK